MIYRKWSLLTGPTTILGGIVGTLLAANFSFVKDNPFLNSEKKELPPTKELKQ